MNFIILNNNEYNIEIKIKDLKNIDDIEMLYFNRLKHIIKHIPNENYIIHKLYLYKIKSLMKQPIPLKSENDIKTNFAVIQKIDGIRSLMFINEYGKVFLIKNNLTIIIKTNLMCDYLSNVIIDGELINDNIFYAIDIILYDNINLEGYDLKSRINILKNISFIKNNYDKNIYYKVKKYYFNNILEHCKKLSKIKNYHITNKMKNEIPVDGLIFNSMSENYRNCKIYKWKPIITFDFKILKCQYNNGEYNLWKLYCYTYNKEYILFPIEKYNKVLINYKLDKIYNNNEIIEFIFDENNDSFYPIKVRNDKIYPNFVNIAIDNWNCLDIIIRF